MGLLTGCVVNGTVVVVVVLVGNVVVVLVGSVDVVVVVEVDVVVVLTLGWKDTGR